eukprot:TRINITY_DN20986_c0_g1_i1.p1 TRINITY_DN20986_c0_g1~~TRINITY_DN20986_c0_g1_i1.p1  ORF type:complete len:131 (-),score=53.76 TRINITY_DN20986_c0_g1_i1:104-472(-)
MGVGLGDFIPGDDPAQGGRSVYKTAVTVYLVLGLLGVMLVIRVFISIPQMDATASFDDTAMEEEDPERQRLQISGALGPLYSEQKDQPTKAGARRIVRARSRREDVDEYEDGGDATPVFGSQ